MGKDIRCEHCGRLLAKETDGVIDVKTTIKQRILIGPTSIVFFCPWLYYTHAGRKLCGKQNKVEYVREQIFSPSGV